MIHPSPNNILIIDDDARNIFALSAVLKARGFTCISATRALDGIKLLEARDDIGVILLDMMMPEMDGYEAIGKIRETIQRHVPIVSVTAQAMAGDREKCLQAGADGYIPKPVDLEELISLLRHYLNDKK